MLEPIPGLNELIIVTEETLRLMRELRSNLPPERVEEFINCSLELSENLLEGLKRVQVAIT